MQDIEVKQAYNMMKEQDKINFGEYHKTLLHIHTPTSHDYKLYDEWNKQYFQSISEDEIFRIAKEENVLFKKIFVFYSYESDLKSSDFIKYFHKNQKKLWRIVVI